MSGKSGKSGKRALIIVDLQGDFLPGGPLGVPEGDQIIDTVVALLGRFDVVVATQDWHPPEHGSFAANNPGCSVGEVIDLHGLAQVLWPVHCVQGTPGAELVPQLRDRVEIARVFRKGSDPKVDSYSGFFDNGKSNPTGLGDWLQAEGVTEVVVCGLALDYCVKFTALDALALGFATTVISDATRAVNLAPGDGDKAITELRAAGAKVVHSDELLVPPDEVIAQGKWLRLIRRGRWEFAQRTVGGTAALIVAVTDQRELILIEQVRPPIGGRTIELPAGLIGDIAGAEDEAPELAAARELEEETGFYPARLELVADGTSSAGLSDERLLMFRAYDLKQVGDGGGIEHENIVVHRVPLAEVPAFLQRKQQEGLVVDIKIWSALYFATGC